MVKTVFIIFVFSLCGKTPMAVFSGGRMDYSKSGDVVIAALLSISKGDHCEEENPAGILLAEAVIHTVSQNHSSLSTRNYTLGYYIKDTCGSLRHAVQAAFDLVTPELKNSSSDQQMLGRIITVLIDASNSSTQTVVRGILDAYGLPWIQIGQIDLGETNLSEKTSKVTSDFLKVIDYSWVAVVASDVVGSPTFLHESELTRQVYCLARGAISTREKLPRVNPVRAKHWENVARANLVVILSGVEEAEELLEVARQNGVRNKTWLIVNEASTPYYALKETRLGEVILLLTKDVPNITFEELDVFRLHLNKHRVKSRPWKLGSHIAEFLANVSQYIKNYTHNNQPSSVSLVSSVNHAADVLMKVSYLRSTLDAMLSTNFTLRESTFNISFKRIADLRAKLKSCVTKYDSEHSCSEQPDPPFTKGYTLRKAHYSNPADNRTFSPVGHWTNNSGWKITPSEISTLKKHRKVWKCPRGRPVKLPLLYWDNCRQFACLTCPTDSEAMQAGWRNNSCRLCTPRGCLDVSLVYVTFWHPLALTVTCLCVLGEACVIFVVVIFSMYRKTPVVKSSNRVFNFLMLTTLGLWFAVVPCFLGRPGYLKCNTIVAVFLVFYATISSILLSKTVRLLLIFKSMQQRSKWLGNTSFFITTIAFILFQVFLCTTNYLLHPVNVETRLRADAVLLYCGRRLSPATALGFAYNCLLSGLCCFFAYKVRKLPQNFNEAKYISFAVFSYGLSWMIVLTGYYDVNCSAKQNTVICLGLAVGGFSVLVCLFSPKVFTILFCPQLNTKSVTVEAARRYSVEASVSLGGLRPSRTRSSTLDLPLPSSPSYRIDYTPPDDNFLGVAGVTRPRAHSDCSISNLVAERRCRLSSACSMSQEESGSSPTSSSESRGACPI